MFWLGSVPVISHVKKKCTLVQALSLSTGRTAHWRSRGIALLFLDHGTRRGWGVNATPRPLFTPGKDSVPIVQEAGWASGPVWTGAENLAPTGIRSLDRPARSQSLYWLSYSAPISHVVVIFFSSVVVYYLRWEFLSCASTVFCEQYIMSARLHVASVSNYINQLLLQA